MGRKVPRTINWEEEPAYDTNDENFFLRPRQSLRCGDESQPSSPGERMKLCERAPAEEPRQHFKARPPPRGLYCPFTTLPSQQPLTRPRDAPGALASRAHKRAALEREWAERWEQGQQAAADFTARQETARRLSCPARMQFKPQPEKGRETTGVPAARPAPLTMPHSPSFSSRLAFADRRTRAKIAPAPGASSSKHTSSSTGPRSASRQASRGVESCWAAAHSPGGTRA